MTAILEASGRISGISSAMDEVAFQTKLLALNAAIEAARAGNTVLLSPLSLAKFVPLLKRVRHPLAKSRA